MKKKINRAADKKQKTKQAVKKKNSKDLKDVKDIKNSKDLKESNNGIVQPQSNIKESVTFVNWTSVISDDPGLP